MISRFTLPGLLCATLLLALAPGALATEPADLDLFLPNTLEDAFTGAPGSEVQFGAAYDRRRGRDEFRLRPILQVTPVDRLQFNLNLPYTLGSSERANEGELSAGVLYNLNREGRWLPAFALALDASTPIGPGDRATEVQVTGIATRSLDASGFRRVHLNLSWSRRFAPSEDERVIGYRAAAGYSHQISPDTVLIADYVRQRQDVGERDSNVIEVGARMRLTKGITVGLGAGVGIGRDSPRARALFSLEFDL